MSTICKRVLFKVSGEALMGKQSFGHDFETLLGIAEDVKEVISVNTPEYEFKICQNINRLYYSPPRFPGTTGFNYMQF